MSENPYQPPTVPDGIAPVRPAGPMRWWHVALLVAMLAAAILGAASFAMLRSLPTSGRFMDRTAAPLDPADDRVALEPQKDTPVNQQ